MAIDLQQFCANNDQACFGRDYLLRPIHVGDWSLASNGHIAVRVPRAAGSDVTPDVPQSVLSIFDDHSTEDAGELPLFTPPIGECDCTRCGGTGIDEDDDYGGVTKSTCDICEGTGKIPLLHVTSIEINETIMAARYLQQIRALPFPKLAYGFWPGRHDPERPQQRVHFAFEGGIGLLMPLRRPYATHFQLSRPGAAS
ncbi:hypothetical protein SAMN05216456_1940 [Devosia crocina]|uniref:Uncharacterized protein n=1 Tax=Devosia crocina TaxID=429728 RepID=A0A1I7NF48_9HYPH|nr:hypothetical protein [Devosia crocina]SFV33269.1 hypothetical protein SAMN05216456_1940 [Devosia crocina]